MLTPVPNPPPRTVVTPGNRRGLWADRLAPARAKPGQWFLLDGDWSQAVAGQIRSGRVKGVARGEFETRRRRQANGRYHVYVRFVGASDLPDWAKGWTLARVVEEKLPRRWSDEGDMQVQLPGTPERWIDVGRLPAE